MKYSNCYDYYFTQSATRIFNDRINWLWFKAMAIAESRLDPEAVSPVLALGVMQLMPRTAAMMAEKLEIKNDLRAPHLNIHLGIGYSRRCWNIWKEEKGVERIRFMLGSYNAGPGHIVKAQWLAESRDLPTDRWQSIVATLPDITSRHAEETVGYVNRVENFYHQLKEG